MFKHVAFILAFIVATLWGINGATTLISAPNTAEVFIGLAALLAIFYGWSLVARYYIRFFQRKAVQDEIEKLFGIDSGR